MKKFALASCTLLFMGCLFGSSKMSKMEAPVATVDGRIITVASLDSTIKQLQKNVDPSTPAESLKLAALDTLVSRKLIEIRTDSVKKELNSDWEFNQKRLDDVGQVIMKILFEKQIQTRAKVDSLDVYKHYVENQANYMDAEQVKARHILIRSKPDTVGVTDEKKKKKLIEDSDKFALKMAEAVMQKALAGEPWDSLATAHSEDKNNANKGGDLGYFTRGRMVAEFDSVAFSAEPGSINGPIATKFGYHIIKVEDHKQAQPMPYDENLYQQIYSEMLNDVQGKLANAFLDSLKQAAALTHNEELLVLPDSTWDDHAWMMTVNATDTIFAKTVKESLPRYKRWKKLDTLTVADTKDMLSMMSTTYLLRSAARTLGYMEDPQVVKGMQELTDSEASLRMNHYLRNLDYDPSEEEVAAYFQAHADDYIEKRKLLIYHILFQDSLQAEAVRDTIITGTDFAEMAKRYYPGDPDIREVLYNLDYIGPDEMGPKFYGAADTMKVGDVSHPVKTDWGYHLIKLVNRKQDRTLAQVRPGIRQKLSDTRDAERTAKLVGQWRLGADIRINQKTLSAYQPVEKKVIPIEARASEQKGD